MYGQINRIASAPEHREALQALLLTGSDAMPGCIAYIVAIEKAMPMITGFEKVATLRPVGGKGIS